MLSIRWVQLYISVSYVLAIYLSRNSRASHKQRSEPQIVRQRIKNISIVCLLNIILVPMLISYIYNGITFNESFLQLGIIPGYHFNGRWDLKQSIINNIKCIILISVLYMGPLSDLLLYYMYAGTNENMLRDFMDNFTDIWGVRNYIFAPVTEELVYTAMLLSCHITMDRLAGHSTRWSALLFEPSLYFGIAHLHHAWEMYQDKEYKISQIVAITFFQAVYTTIFGTLSNYIYLRNGGNLWSCILLHGICNLLGFPGKPELSQVLVSSTSQGRWIRCYYVLLLCGLVSFSVLLVPLTSSPYSI